MNQLSVKEEMQYKEKCMQEFAAKAAELKKLTDEVTKEVRVQISAEDIMKLKDNGYKMCFAKKVGTEQYNVIWQSYENFSENNKFSWTPIYQVFRTDTFQTGVTVETSSAPKNIGLGEITIIDKYGILSSPVTGGDSTAINVDNEYKATHVGISQLSTGLDGNTVSTPIYVSENECMLGSAKFKPVEKVLIWFESNVQTSTMFTDMRTNSIEVDLTQTNLFNLRYENEQWFVI